MHTTTRGWRPVVHCMRAMKKLKSTAAVHRLPSRYTKVHRTAGRSLLRQVHHCGFYLHDSANDASTGFHVSVNGQWIRRSADAQRDVAIKEFDRYSSHNHVHGSQDGIGHPPYVSILGSPPRRRSRTLTFILRSRSQRSSRDTIDPYADFMAIHTPRSSLKALPPDFKSETGVPGDRLDACILDPLA